MVRVKLDVIGRGDGAAERAREAQSTPRTQHIIATAATRALEFESRPGAASVAVLILSAGGGGAISATTPIPSDEFSIICLPATEGTHPSTRTATTERVLQPPSGRGRCRGSAYRTAVIKRHWSAAPWPFWSHYGTTSGKKKRQKNGRRTHALVCRFSAVSGGLLGAISGPSWMVCGQLGAI